MFSQERLIPTWCIPRGHIPSPGCSPFLTQSQRQRSCSGSTKRTSEQVFPEWVRHSSPSIPASAHGSMGSSSRGEGSKHLLRTMNSGAPRGHAPSPGSQVHFYRTVHHQDRWRIRSQSRCTAPVFVRRPRCPQPQMLSRGTTPTDGSAHIESGSALGRAAQNDTSSCCRIAHQHPDTGAHRHRWECRRQDPQVAAQAPRAYDRLHHHIQRQRPKGQVPRIQASCELLLGVAVHHGRNGPSIGPKGKAWYELLYFPLYPIEVLPILT